MAPGQYIMGDDATLESLFLKKPQTVTTGLFEYRMARSHLDDLVNALHESGSSPPAFLKPSIPSNPEANPSNPEVNFDVWAADDNEDDNYDVMFTVNDMLQQGVLEADDDFQARVDHLGQSPKPTQLGTISG